MLADTPTGCFVDCAAPDPAAPGCTGRILPHMVAVRNLSMTALDCAFACRSLNFSLAAVEASYGCACGDARDNANPRRPDSECCAPCSGDSTQWCGAKYRAWIFDASATRAAQLGPPASTCDPNERGSDSRNLFNGTLMLQSAYLDQPYCDIMPTSGRWVCTITDNDQTEGHAGEHVAAFWSDDLGASWSTPVPVEPLPIGQQLANAYSMTLAAPGVGAGGVDRVFSIYNMNLQNVTTDGPGGPHITRTDMLGGFFMRYSDDEVPALLFAYLPVVSSLHLFPSYLPFISSLHLFPSSLPFICLAGRLLERRPLPRAVPPHLDRQSQRVGREGDGGVDGGPAEGARRRRVLRLHQDWQVRLAHTASTPARRAAVPLSRVRALGSPALHSATQVPPRPARGDVGDGERHRIASHRIA